jgi:hypothetical protein
MKIHIPTSQSAFSQKALRNGMKRSKLTVVSVLLSQSFKNFSERHESSIFLVDILTINLNIMRTTSSAITTSLFLTEN